MTQDEEITLLDYWRVLRKRRRLIWRLTGAACLLSVVISLLLPKIYAATASVLPPQPEAPLASPFMMAAGGSGGGAAGLGLAGSFLGLKSPSDLWVGILKSQNVFDAVIERFKLRDLYGKDTIEDTRDALADRVDVAASKEGIVSVTAYDRDPKRAADMANAFIDELDRLNRQTVTSSGGRMRSFVERRLAETRQALAGAEDKLKVFQQANQAVKLDDQSTAVIEAYGRLKAELAAKEVELGGLMSVATASHPQVELTRNQVEEIKRQLRKMEQGSPRAGDIFLATERVPDVGLRYARLLRDVKYQEALFELLTQQYEVARIQEAKDTPTVQVLDRARVPEKKAKPRRSLIVLLSTAAALMAGCFAAFFLEYLETQRLRESDAA